jgi:hypothetical protein
MRFTSKMTHQRILVISIVFICIGLSACGRKKRKSTRTSDFSFYIPEAEVHITTSKRTNAQFFVFFSRKPGTEALSDSVSYIECETMKSTIAVIFNPKEEKNIYVLYPSIKKIHNTDFNLQELTGDQFDTLFHEKRIRTNPLILKRPYIELSISPATYSIILQRDSSFKNQTRIKEGDIYGGW